MRLFSNFRRAALLVAPVVATLQIAACSSGVTDPVARTTSFSVDGALVPGQAITLRGGVASAGATVLIDGRSAEVISATAQSVMVRVPDAVSCETDGRQVSIAVTNDGSAAQVKARLAIPSLTLAVGESRTVRDGDCLQLARGGARYAFAAEGMERDTLWYQGRLRVGHAPASAMQASRAAVGSFARLQGADGRPSPLSLATSTIGAAQAALELDPALATAGVGDQVTLPNWNAPRSCSSAPDQVPVKPYTVLAVAGSTVTVIANDAPEASTVIGDPSRIAAIAAGTAQVEQWLDPAVTAVLGDAPAWRSGANSRRFIALDNLFAAQPGYEAMPVTRCPNAWGINLIFMPSKVALFDGSVNRELAGVAIHEFAHIADLDLTNLPSRSDRGFFAEALAVNVQESAVRLASGTPSASWTQSEGQAGIANPWPKGPVQMADAEGLQAVLPALSPSWYSRGALLLLMAREMDGSAQVPRPAGSGPALYQRLIAATEGRDPTVEDIAAVIGVTRDSLLARTTRATLMSADASARGVPGAPFGTWQFEGWTPVDGFRVLPGATADVPFSVAGGGLWTRFLETDADIGVSVRAEVPASGARVQVTRVR